MESDLEIVKKIRDKEDHEDALTRELEKKLKAEVEQLQKDGIARTAETRKKLAADYSRTMDDLRGRMDSMKSEMLREAEEKASKIKLEMSSADLRDLVKRTLTQYLEE